MTIKAPIHYRPDIEWSALAAELAVSELIAGNLIGDAQFEFAKRIIAQQIHVLLITGLRPAQDDVSS